MHSRRAGAVLDSMPSRLLAIAARGHEQEATSWFIRVRVAAAVILALAALGYIWGVVSTPSRSTSAPAPAHYPHRDWTKFLDAQRLARLCVTVLAAVCVPALYPRRDWVRSGRVTLLHAALLAVAVVLHFIGLLQDLGASELDLHSAGDFRAGVLRAMGKGQVTVVFGIPFAFFHAAIFSLFAHAKSLRYQRLALRDARGKELILDELANGVRLLVHRRT
ncbi:hypothetical protein T492DRAFT_1002902 [Pavlovales sp. CCMP2436]|nr:hypothetical protein T492DRAFT_1002902 [Pavlovales sp. CCMP2436]|mmetsp:Transcript_48859/g.114444  ORF Transcript_48859/g.114444 Transcript_48859/m.114444 type:complete len:220 (+) Transcript_48859:179-838(+)